ncbi:MAG: hypothetical protein ACLS9K_11835 [Lachnospira eligens]
MKGLFTSPVETVSAFVAKANVIMIAILIGGQAIINMLTRLFDMLIANSKAKVTTEVKSLTAYFHLTTAHILIPSHIQQAQYSRTCFLRFFW